MTYWRNWNRSFTAGLVLSVIPLLVARPQNMGDALFLPAIGAALMFVYAHRNGRVMQGRGVAAWIVALLVIPFPFVAAMYLVELQQRSWSLMSTAAVTGFGFAAATGIAAVLAAVAQRSATNGWLSKFLSAIDPKGPG